MKRSCWYPLGSLTLESFWAPRSMPQEGWVLNGWDGKVRVWSDGWGNVFLGWRMGLLVHRCLVHSSFLPSNSVGETIHPFFDHSLQLLCWMRTPQSRCLWCCRVASTTGIFTTGNLLCLVLWMDYQGNITTLFILPNWGKMEQVEEVLTPKILTRWNNLPWKR